MLYTKFKILPLLFLLISNCTFAAGITFDEKKVERFETKFDKTAGWLVVDNDQKLEFMLCPVGATSEIDKPLVCNGKAQDLNYLDANRLVAKIGNGWRLPKSSEMEKYAKDKNRHMNLNYYVLVIFQKSGFQTDFYWTNTGVTEYPNKHFALQIDNTYGYRDLIDVDDQNKNAVYLVRSKR
jgi:hypothetical protein